MQPTVFMYLPNLHRQRYVAVNCLLLLHILHAKYFDLIILNLKLHFCTKDSFSLLLILLGLRRSLWSLSAAPIQVPGCFRRLQAGPGETAGPTLQGLHLLQSAVKITLLYNQFSTVKNSIIFQFFKKSSNNSNTTAN